MNRIVKVFLLLILFLYLDYSIINACTVFMLNRDSSILFAKNLDWPIGDGMIYINIRNEEKKAFSNNSQSFCWRSLYGSVTFNQFGKEFPLGGMNEKGLAVEELNYSLSKYPEGRNKRLNEFQWIQYQLDNFSTVNEVVEHIHDITIELLLCKLHYMVCDREGNIAVIEFINGEILIFSNQNVPVPVLSNNSYNNSLKYLKNFKGFGGEMIAKEGPESPDRFVRAAALLNSIDEIHGNHLFDKAFSILNAVRQRDTQWSIIYDISNLTVYYQTKQNPVIQKFLLSDFDFSWGVKMVNLFDKHHGQEDKFHDYSYTENIQLIEKVLKNLVTIHELSADREKYLVNRYKDYYEMKK